MILQKCGRKSQLKLHNADSCFSSNIINNDKCTLHIHHTSIDNKTSSWVWPWIDLKSHNYIDDEKTLLLCISYESL